MFSGFPVVNDPLYNHTVFGPEKGRGGNIGKSDEQLIQDLIAIHNAENWLGLDEEGGGVGGGICDSMLIPRLPAPPMSMSMTMTMPTSTSPKSSDISTMTTSQRMKTVTGRSETPDSAVDVHSSSADSPSSSSSASDFHIDVGTSVSTKSVDVSAVDDQDKVTTATQTGIEEADEVPIPLTFVNL